MTDIEPPKEKIKTKRAAGCLIFDEQGRILLLHRNIPGRVQLELPGGKVNPDELPANGAKRELLEELGIEVSFDPYKDYVGSQGFTEDGILYDYYWFAGKIVSGKPTVKEKDKFDQARYWSWEELSQTEEPLSLNLKNLIEAHSSKVLRLPEQSS